MDEVDHCYSTAGSQQVSFIYCVIRCCLNCYINLCLVADLIIPTAKTSRRINNFFAGRVTTMLCCWSVIDQNIVYACKFQLLQHLWETYWKQTSKWSHTSLIIAADNRRTDNASWTMHWWSNDLTPEAGGAMSLRTTSTSWPFSICFIRSNVSADLISQFSRTVAPSIDRICCRSTLMTWPCGSSGTTKISHLKYYDRLKKCKLPTLYCRWTRWDMIETQDINW